MLISLLIILGMSFPALANENKAGVKDFILDNLSEEDVQDLINYMMDLEKKLTNAELASEAKDREIAELWIALEETRDYARDQKLVIEHKDQENKLLAEENRLLLEENKIITLQVQDYKFLYENHKPSAIDRLSNGAGVLALLLFVTQLIVR